MSSLSNQIDITNEEICTVILKQCKAILNFIEIIESNKTILNKKIDILTKQNKRLKDDNQILSIQLSQFQESHMSFLAERRNYYKNRMKCDYKKENIECDENTNEINQIDNEILDEVDLVI